jgi:LmbE family N-acetylglucosaminyl deacetylase
MQQKRFLARLTACGLLVSSLGASVSSREAGSTLEAGKSVRQQSNTLDVVIVAHADDWQVFLGDVVVERIKSGRHPVFIYLTAGDHGWNSVYWRQRESAAIKSTRVALAPSPTTPAYCDTVQVSSHPIRRCLVGGSESFFLRLPDGNRNGRGFASNRFESLRKLRSRQLGILAVDSSTSYATWQDLTATVSGLVRMVADSTNRHEIVLHTTDPSVRVNPHDHYDHRMAGKLAETLLQTNEWSGRYYMGYALATRAPNRTSIQRQEKLEVFSAYDRAMMQINPKWSAYGEHPRFYADCIQRTYSRSFKRTSLSARTR